jgi:hypothetical protein
VDKWEELGGNPFYYDPPPASPADRYEAWDQNNPSPTATGYSNLDIGTEVIIKPSQGNNPGQPNDSWYFPFDAANIPGGSNYREAIAGCTDPDFVYTIGQLLWVEPGAMIGPTKQGFQDLINEDPNARWDHDPNVNCIVDQSQLGSGNPANCRGSVRLRPAPMMDPNTTPGNGKKQVAISNFAGVFVDRIQGNDIYVVFGGYSGVLPANLPPGPTPPIALVLRLIE